MTQSIEEQIRALPAIEAKLHLFQVRREMLRADAVPRSSDTALEKRKRRFDCVGVDVSDDVSARTVIDCFVAVGLSEFFHCELIRCVVVGKDHVHILADVLADIPSKRSGLSVMGMKETEIAVTLTNTDDHLFVVHFGGMPLTAILAVNVGHIHFDLAIQHRLVRLCHRVTDAMAEVPRSFITHSDRALNLESGHTLLCFTEQMCCEEPLCQGQVRIIENCSGSNGKLIIAILAVKELLFRLQFDHGAFAAQALRAFREAETNKQFTALIFGAKQSVYIN